MKPSAECKKVGRELNRQLTLLEATTIDSAVPGFFRNEYDRYWAQATFDRVVRLYREFIALAPDDAERNAAQYGLAALLKNALLLDDAAELCEITIRARPARAYADQNLLAFIEARRGNIARARELALIVNANPEASSFRIDESDIEKESQLRAYP